MFPTDAVTIVKVGQTILLVKQNAGMSLKVADRGHIISNGVILPAGKSKELLDDGIVKDIYLGGIEPDQGEVLL